MSDIDIIDEFADVGPLIETPLEMDARVFKKDIYQIAYQVSDAMTRLRARAGRHGMTALRTIWTGSEWALINQVVQKADQLIKAVAKNHDPGELPDEPDPAPVPEPEPIL